MFIRVTRLTHLKTSLSSYAAAPRSRRIPWQNVQKPLWAATWNVSSIVLTPKYLRWATVVTKCSLFLPPPLTCWTTLWSGFGCSWSGGHPRGEHWKSYTESAGRVRIRDGHCEKTGNPSEQFGRREWRDQSVWCALLYIPSTTMFDITYIPQNVHHKYSSVHFTVSLENDALPDVDTTTLIDESKAGIEVSINPYMRCFF